MHTKDLGRAVKIIGWKNQLECARLGFSDINAHLYQYESMFTILKTAQAARHWGFVAPEPLLSAEQENEMFQWFIALAERMEDCARRKLKEIGVESE